MSLKTTGIPIWVTLALGITVLLGIGAGTAALLGQGMSPEMNISWGGRNLGLGLVALVAIWSKSHIAYLAAFAGGIGREIGDIMSSFASGSPQWGLIIFAVILLAVWVYGISLTIKAKST